MRSAGPFGWWLLTFFFAASLVAPSADGQSARDSRADVLTIVNSRQTDVPSERAQVLMLTTCHMVAEQFHRKMEDVDLKITLILGEPSERFAINDSGRMTMYLQRWDESRFVNGVISGAIERLMPPHTRKQMFAEIVQRTDKIAPVAANQLRNTPVSPRPDFSPGCMSATSRSPCKWPDPVQW